MYINLFLTELQIRSTSSGFFEETINNINRVLTVGDVQWVIYSAHDTTVANMLVALNFTNAQCIYEAYLQNSNQSKDEKGEDGNYYNPDTCIFEYPGYSANIIFELYK
jgi:hypothetical protein